jgi:hypothetical protein
MQTQMTLKQKICSNRSVMHMKCCQIQKHAAGMTDSAMLAFLVLVQVAVLTHSVAAAVLATSLKRSSAAAVDVIKLDLHEVKT